MGKVLVIKGADFSSVAIEQINIKTYIGIDVDIETYFAQASSKIPYTDSVSLASGYGNDLGFAYSADGISIYTNGQGTARVYLVDVNNLTAEFITEKAIAPTGLEIIDIPFITSVNVGQGQFLAVKFDDCTGGDAVVKYGIPKGDYTPRYCNWQSYVPGEDGNVTLGLINTCCAFVPYSIN